MLKLSKKTMIIAGSALAAALSVGIAALILINKNNEDVPAAFMPDSESSLISSMVLTEEIKPAEFVNSSAGLSKRAENLIKINSDTVGYIKINNTYVDYPVVQIPNDPELGNSYYIDYNFYDEYSSEGAIFLDYRNYFGPDESLHSDNLILYGHNMANDTMFGSLSLYRRDYSFYAENSIITLSSNYKDYKYQIFGFFIVSGSSNSDFKYWNCFDFNTEEDFNYYVDNVRYRALVDIDADVKYGDKLLTLSTCYSDADNSRFVIVAKQIQ